MPLTIASRTEDGLAVLELSGTLTLGPHLASLRRCVRETLDSGKVAGLVLQVSGLTAIDSSGLGELTVVYSHVTKRKCPVLLVGVNPSLRNMLEMTHLDGLLPAAADMNAAKKHLKRVSA
ncbi:MAG: STAS domain-containing protein [Acidobacteriaceae bacterium]|nr:STAS domain-containing protein [Acidobacteriaceae bacterium]